MVKDTEEKFQQLFNMSYLICHLQKIEANDV